MSSLNPFDPSRLLEDERGIFAENAKRLRGGFLHRTIVFRDPIQATLVYDGWWFRQIVMFDDIVVWRRISWLTIHRSLEFTLPSSIGDASLDHEQRRGSIELTFGVGLSIRRFQVKLGGIVIYDEIC